MTPTARVFLAFVIGGLFAWAWAIYAAPTLSATWAVEYSYLAVLAVAGFGAWLAIGDGR